MKLLIPMIAVALFVSATAFAQSAADKAAVMKPIDALFLGMKKGDSALAHSAFAKRVNFIRVGKNKEGQTSLSHDNLQDFLNAVARPHAEPWNELIWDTEIRIDNDFADVYAKFAFHLGTKLNHCGVDAFHLYKTPDGSWKIFDLADTHQKDGCVVPKEVTARLVEQK